MTDLEVEIVIGEFTGACFVIHRLLKFQRWNDEIAHVFRFAGCAVFMAGVLATENFFVW